MQRLEVSCAARHIYTVYIYIYVVRREGVNSQDSKQDEMGEQRNTHGTMRNA